VMKCNLQRGRVLTDKVISRDIEMSRAADVLDADLKCRLCFALNLTHTALVHEAVFVYSPTAQTLLSALAVATATDSGQEPAAQWRFVSDQQETLRFFSTAYSTSSSRIALRIARTKYSLSTARRMVSLISVWYPRRIRACGRPSADMAAGIRSQSIRLLLPRTVEIRVLWRGGSCIAEGIVVT
jgi:hypothetical protein